MTLRGARMPKCVIDYCRGIIAVTDSFRRINLPPLSVGAGCRQISMNENEPGKRGQGDNN
ncbi:hypothetical protein C8R21_1138 [Nitrosospira multiformis]|jgi:hypothetical protein|uniref:Uncharacterized protein n=1 Tax=Nitrosospira multiformis TaxID=1231 RepID=A0A2T5IAF4_9PROT|nr:hypothetical protein C8R21_1138 [Nitrosospira multiformis]